MTGRGVAVQIERACLPEHPAELEQPRCHHRQVGHHIARAQKRSKRDQGFGDFPTLMDRVLICFNRRGVPPPGILERFDLRGCPRAGVLSKEHVVILVAVEWGIQIDEIYTLVTDVPAEHVKVVAIEEMVHRRHVARSSWEGRSSGSGVVTGKPHGGGEDSPGETSKSIGVFFGPPAEGGGNHGNSLTPRQSPSFQRDQILACRMSWTYIAL